jgi:hypothetical protein
VLERLAPGAWYVGEDGITRLGARPAATLPAGVTHGPVDRARGTVTLASEKIAAILPGVIVDGLTAEDVAHEVSASHGLRSTIWGQPSVGTSSALASLRVVLEQLDPNRKFRGVSEYRVVTATGKRLNLQPIRVSLGMPDLPLVPIRPGIPGADCSDVALGSRVVVGFVDSDPSRPYVDAFEDADSAGFAPNSLTFLQGSAGLARVGDEVTITAAQLATAGATSAPGGGAVTVTTPLKCTITSGSTKVRCG